MQHRPAWPLVLVLFGCAGSLTTVEWGNLAVFLTWGVAATAVVGLGGALSAGRVCGG
jgi:hypothetical protein